MPSEGLVCRAVPPAPAGGWPWITAIPAVSPVIPCYLPVLSLFRMQPSGRGKSAEGASMLVIRMIVGPGGSEKREIYPVFFPVSRDLGPILLPVIGS
jgi:hypothetical protein